MRSVHRADNNSEDDSTSLGLASSPRLVRRSQFGSSLASMADNESPDVTPTGSLRKRRNRSSPEIDDNSLLDYLKQAEQAQQQGWRTDFDRNLVQSSWHLRAASAVRESLKYSNEFQLQAGIVARPDASRQKTLKTQIWRLCTRGRRISRIFNKGRNRQNHLLRHPFKQPASKKTLRVLRRQGTTGILRLLLKLFQSVALL